MATGRALLQVHVDDLQGESLPFTWSWTMPLGILRRTVLGWGPGDTTLANIPVGTIFIVIEPPTTTPGTLTLKGNAGDTGVSIRSTMATPLTYGGITPVILTASQAVSGVQITYLG